MTTGELLNHVANLQAKFVTETGAEPSEVHFHKDLETLLYQENNKYGRTGESTRLVSFMGMKAVAHEDCERETVWLK